MSRIELITERERELYKRTLDGALLNVEQFRFEAARAYNDFTSSDRAAVARLQGRNSSADDFFILWLDELRVQRKKLVRSQGDPGFIESLEKGLQLSAVERDVKVASIISARDQELITQGLDKIYNQPHKQQRIAALRLLERNDDEIEKLYRRYVALEVYTHVAHMEGVALYDPHASRAGRLLQRYTISKQRRQLRKKENRRLQSIEGELSELMKWNEGLAGAIHASGIDAIALIAAKAKYEKHLMVLHKGERNNPGVQITIYNDIVSDLRKRYGSRLKARTESLQGARQATQALDDICVRVFDLTNAKKNELLTVTKKIRELEKEQELILTAREARLAVEKQFYRY